MKRLAILFLPILGLFFGTGCERRDSSRDHSVRFHTAEIRTRTEFSTPDGDLYPALWTAEDRTVRISPNGAAPVEAAVQASDNGRSASFEARFTTGGDESCTFYALSPSVAFRSLSGSEWDYESPAIQTPGEHSVDPAAMVLAATSSTTEGLPAEVQLPFRHLSAYGLLTLEGLNTDLRSVTVDFSGEHSLTLNTTSTRNIWFGTKPEDLSGKELTFTAKTGSGSYRRSVTFPEGRALEAGKVARFSIDMSQAGFEPDSKSISILAIGNSFSIDAMQYLYGYLQQAGYEDIFLGNLYIGGCTLQTHAGHIANNDNAYQYYTNSTGSWSSVSGGNIVTALKSRRWDYVSMQQASGFSGTPDTYEPYLSSIVETVKEHCPGAKRMWHMTWAYQADCSKSEFSQYGCVQIRMYNAILDAVRTKVVSRGDFDFVIPCGTAIQNLRTSLVGDTVTRDGYHMSYDIGRVATALMWLKQISGCSLEGIDIKPSGYSVATDKAPAIKDAVEKAYAHPMEVTASAYPPDRTWNTSDPALRQIFADAGYDPARYRELPYSLTFHAFYDSSRGFSLNSTASNSNQFAATQFFSREDIPEGSVLVLKKGYQYRPERWTRLSATTRPRPGPVTSSILEVNDAWWTGNAYRAFNLAKENNPPLTDQQQQELRSCLSIFVPVEN